MKILLLLTILVSIFLSPLADARSYRSSPNDGYTRGYTKKNGTVVKPYYHTQKNSTKRDNYSCIDKGRC